MKYLLAFICPPLAVITTGRMFLAFLTALFWPPTLWLIILIGVNAAGVFGLDPNTLRVVQTNVVAMLTLAVVNWFSFFWIIPTVTAILVILQDDRERRHQEQLSAMKHNSLMTRGAMRQIANRPTVVVVQAPQPRVVPRVIEAKPLPPPK